MRKISLKYHSWIDLLYLCLIGIVFSLAGYSFGTNNQIEQLPLIMRAVDSGFLLNDFFVNANVEFGPRFYYAHFMALLTHLISIPWLYFILTCLTNISVALITYHVAYRLFRKSRLSGILSGFVPGNPMCRAAAIMFRRSSNLKETG